MGCVCKFKCNAIFFAKKWDQELALSNSSIFWNHNLIPMRFGDWLNVAVWGMVGVE